MKVLVVGAGAVGSLFGARLAQAGHSVELVGRPEHVAAIAARGLIVRDGTEETVPLTAHSSLAAPTAAEAVLLTVKTFGLESAARELARSVSFPAPTLLPQNGLGVEPVAWSGLSTGGWPTPESWTVRAIHSVPATLVAPGVVRAAGTGEILLPRSNAARAPVARVQLFRELFAGAGFSVRLVTDLAREEWRKAIVNAAINPVTAVRGIPNGRLLEEPGREEALALLREALEVARSAGVRFDEKELVQDFERVARATAENRSSMLQDLDRGRPTEIDAISGEMLRVAAAHGIDLPRTRTIVAEVLRRTRGRAVRP